MTTRTKNSPPAWMMAEHNARERDRAWDAARPRVRATMYAPGRDETVVEDPRSHTPVEEPSVRGVTTMKM